MRIGIYPGTFDPITNGHIDILIRGKKIVDKLIIAVSPSINKHPTFTLEERCKMVNSYITAHNITKNIEVMELDGLLVDFAFKNKATIIIRGLRAMSDFEYEFQMACMNSKLNPNIETIFLPSSEKNQFISSKLIKEIASLGGDIREFVIPPIAKKVISHYKNL